MGHEITTFDTYERLAAELQSRAASTAEVRTSIAEEAAARTWDLMEELMRELVDSGITARRYFEVCQRLGLPPSIGRPNVETLPPRTSSLAEKFRAALADAERKGITVTEPDAD